MRLVAASLFASPLLAASLGLIPPVITQCRDGFARARLQWDAGGSNLVQVRLSGSGAKPLSGWVDPAGSLETGDWVTDGMAFVLADESGRELARAVAIVQCTPSASRNSYFPLDIGNQWIYRVDNRGVTSLYDVWTVIRNQQVGGREYAVISSSMGAPLAFYRVDGQGRVFHRIGPQEQLLLDPAPNPASPPRLRTDRIVSPFPHPLGQFDAALEYTFSESVNVEQGVYIRGVGLAASTSNLLTGLSGGFSFGRTLVSARIGNSVYETFGPSIQLGVETTDLDVTGRKVTNCTVPCYAESCRAGSPVDSPGAYKPCLQARIAARVPSDQARLGVLELTDATGNPVYRAPLRLDAQSAVTYQQVPLFSTPDSPLSPGVYKLNVRFRFQESLPESTSSVSVRVR